MAERRFVNTMIWQEEYFSGLKNVEKLVYLYLLTNTDIEYYGVMTYNLPKIADEIGIGDIVLKKTLKKFEEDSQILIENHLILVKDFIFNQRKTGFNQFTMKKLGNDSYKLPKLIKQTIENLCNDKENPRKPSDEQQVPSQVPSQVPPQQIKKKEDIRKNSNKENQLAITELLKIFDKETLELRISELIEGLTKKFTYEFGWQRNSQDSSYEKFRSASIKILSLCPKNEATQNQIMRYLLKALKKWSEEDSNIKTITPAHLVSGYTWESLLPGFQEHEGMVVSKPFYLNNFTKEEVR